MKKVLIALTSFCAAFLASTPAQADLLSVHVDVPVSFTPSESSVDPDTPTGIKAGVSFFLFPVGLAVENYEVKYSSDSLSLDVIDTYNIVDIFFNLPIPFVNIAIGAGAGTYKAEGTLSGTAISADTTVTNLFASLGYPILPLVDVHLGYQQISGDQVDVSGTNRTADPSGTMITAGIKVGF